MLPDGILRTGKLPFKITDQTHHNWGKHYQGDEVGQRPRSKTDSALAPLPGGEVVVRESRRK